jgi:hypothetical protein
MTFTEWEPLRIGDYVVLSLIFATSCILGLAAFISFLLQGGPDPELEHYADR